MRAEWRAARHLGVSELVVTSREDRRPAPMQQPSKGKAAKKKEKKDEWTVVTKKNSKPSGAEEAPRTQAPRSHQGPPELPFAESFISQNDNWARSTPDYSALPPLGTPTLLSSLPKTDRELLAPVLDENFTSGPEGLLQTTMERVLGTTILLRFHVTSTPESRREGRRMVAALLTSDTFAKAALAQLQKRWASSERQWVRASSSSSPKVTVYPAISAQEFARRLVALLVRGGHQTLTSKTVPSAQLDVTRFLSAVFNRSPANKPVSRAPALQAAFGGLDKELVRYMFSFFDPTTLALSRRVCVAWNRVGSDARLWSELHRRHPDLAARLAIPARTRFYVVEPHNDLVRCQNDGFSVFRNVKGYEHILVALHGQSMVVLVISV